MNKKWTPAIAAVLAAGVMFSGEGMAFAAPKEGVPYNVEASKKENQGKSQSFKSIDKQLSKIEEKLLHYKEKLNKMEEKKQKEKLDEEKAAETPIETPANETITTSAESVDETEMIEEVENDENSAVDEDTEEKVEEVENDENSAVDEDTEEKVEEVENDENSAVDEDTEEKAEEIEKDLENEPGYRGKFQALENRLSAVSNQLAALSSKGAEAALVAERQKRITSLKEEIASVLASIDQIEKAVQDELKADKNVKERAPKKDVSLTKGWTITFSKNLDLETLSALDLIVMDAAGNLVETTFTYSEKTKSITLIPLQPYQKETVYTLYIGNGIEGADGTPLKNTVKMEFTTTTSTTAVANVQEPGFSDVSDRHREAVQSMVDLGLTAGIGGGKFGAEQQIKRADAAVMLAKALNLETGSAPETGFKDVPKRAQAAVNALVKAGILSGKTETAFGADQTLTRGELAIILTRAFKLSNESVDHTFKDVPARYEGAVNAMVENGITNGKTSTAFGTADPIKRGDFAVFFHRAKLAK